MDRGAWRAIFHKRVGCDLTTQQRFIAKIPHTIDKTYNVSVPSPAC